MLRKGMRPAQIRVKFGVSLRTVHNGIARARMAERLASTQRLEGPKLFLIWGASCKPLKLLTCLDVHPCRWCRGRGEGCLACEGTGVGPIPRGTVRTCAVCHQSGHEGHPAVRLDRADVPAPEPKPAATTPKKKIRKERRSIMDRVRPSLS